MFDLKMQDDLHNLLPRLVVFKLFAGVEPQGNIPVAQGTLAHIAAEENYKFIVSCGTCNFWQNPCHGRNFRGGARGAEAPPIILMIQNFFM